MNRVWRFLRNEYAGRCTTAIARKWPKGTKWCGRCPREDCNLTGRVCLVSVVGSVSRKDAPGFSFVAERREGGAR